MKLDRLTRDLLGILTTLFVVALFTPGTARALVYDDVRGWWHLDWADSGAVANATDVRDQRDWGDSVASPGPTGAHATALYGSPQWTNTASVQPAGGQNYGGRSIQFDPYVDTGTGNVIPDAFGVSGLGLTGSSSLVTRFRWDGYASTSSSAWLYNNAFGYGDPTIAGNGGYLFGVTGGSNALTLLFGNRNHISSLLLTEGKWYDAAAVVEDNGTSDSVTLYLWEEGGALQSQTFSANYITTNTGTLNTIVGGEYVTSTPGAGNALKAFKGEVNQLAVWDRALDVNEVNFAVGAPQPTFTLGIDNANTRDLRLEGSVDADYTVGEPWHEMRRAVTSSNNVASVSFDLAAYETNLNRAFHVDISGTGGGSPVVVELLVNGSSLGTRTVTPGDDPLWTIDGGYFATGTNTVSIQYDPSSTGAYVAWDWLELGGAWQVGYDNNSPSEFITEGSAPDDFYVTDSNWMHLERANTFGDPDINLHFELSEELAGLGYMYTTRVVSQGGTGSPHPIDVLVNDNLLQSFPAQPNGTLLQLSIPTWMLQAGDNAITLRYQGLSGGYAQYDFHRLEMVPEPSTLVSAALGLLALALLRWRRRSRSK